MASNNDDGDEIPIAEDVQVRADAQMRAIFEQNYDTFSGQLSDHILGFNLQVNNEGVW